MKIVLAGGGLAAGSAAATLRAQGFDGEIILIGDEPMAPYDRPPLSKALLQGQDPALEFKEQSFWSDNAIELRLGERVTGVRPQDRTLATQKETLRFDKLLIATGGRPRKLSAPGAELAGIHYLRTLNDAHAIRESAQRVERAVVVGMGFIGAEVAASLRQQGLEVIAVEPLEAPLERVVGKEIGMTIANLHSDHGVSLVLGEGVTAFEGSSRLERVITSSGRAIECQMCVVGVGMTPNVEWLQGSGIQVDNGVLVDEMCETSVPGIFAAGDIANHDHPLFGRLRVEHWQNAINQGTAAATNMIASDKHAYADVHWFWSDQYEASLQYCGHHSAGSSIVLRGNLADSSYIAFFVNDGVLEAAFGFNNGRDVRRAMKLIGTRVSNESLEDPNVDLRRLAQS